MEFVVQDVETGNMYMRMGDRYDAWVMANDEKDPLKINSSFFLLPTSMSRTLDMAKDMARFDATDSYRMK